MLRKLKSVFAYSKIERVSLERIKSKIIEANLTMTTILSTFATFLLATILILSFFSKGIEQNRIVYIFGLISSVTIMILSLTVARMNSKVVKVLVYLSYAVYYLYGILIGTVTDPNSKTVTFMVLLVFIPTLFVDWPMRVVSITSIFVAIFVVLCYHNKTGAVLSVDIIDAISFAILGLASGFVVNNIKIRGYILEQQLQEISRIDQLTQMRNRNAYELEHNSILDICRQTLAIIYIDVNGLHEVNNEKGHDFGDKMLKFIASAIKSTFSSELTYRIGGDEFICFVPDKNEEDIETLLHNLNEIIEKENYHIAVGYKVSPIRHISLESLIDEAEKRMLNDKREFYKDIANRKSRNITKKDM